MGELASYGNSGAEPQLTSIGDIGISEHWVLLPSGPRPIRGSVWTVTDMSQTHESVSSAGIVLCLIFVWLCLLGLLFLTMKERRYTGYVQVTVQGNGFHHSTLVPVTGPETVMWATQSVNYARSLAAV